MSQNNQLITLVTAFLAFLQGEPVEAEDATPVKVVKSPKKEPKKTVAPVEPEGPTKEDVSAVVEKLLGADKRKEAVALMKKFKATSVSSLSEADYAVFLEEAEEILLSA
jgi:hypothetical protein